jgi:uncharacterized hydrophobic protein (TIGR00341 family)
VEQRLMARRVVDVYTSSPIGVATALEGIAMDMHVSAPFGDSLTWTRFVVDATVVESAVDRLQRQSVDDTSFRVVVTSLEALLPAPVAPPPPTTPTPLEATPADELKPANVSQRISRDELYGDIDDALGHPGSFLVMTALATAVAIIGLLRGDAAIIVGAMVLAPLLTPNMAIALATRLVDTALLLRAARLAAGGALLAFAMSLVAGAVLTIDPSNPQIHSRTVVSLGDLVLALASGVAGAMALASGAAASLVGVMVAVALLPPLVTSGLLLGAGHPGLAAQAAVLVVANVVCVNLAAITTFAVKGIAPARFWEAARARNATRIALAIWVALLLAVAATIVWVGSP